HRVQLLVAVLDDDELTAAGGLVELLADRLVLDDVDEPDLTLVVGNDRLRIRIPREEQVAGSDLLPIDDRQRGAVRHREAAADRTLLRQHHDLAFTARDDALAARRVDDYDTLELRPPVHL